MTSESDNNKPAPGPARTDDVNKSRAEKMKGKRNALKHGLHSPSTALVRPDRRTKFWRYKEERAEAMFRDQGGRENFAETKQTAVFQKVPLDMQIERIDEWLFSQKSLINKRRKSVLPVLLERNRLVETSLKLAQVIGLERVAKPVPTLADYVRSYEQKAQDETQQAEPTQSSPSEPKRAQEPSAHETPPSGDK